MSELRVRVETPREMVARAFTFLDNKGRDTVTAAITMRDAQIAEWSIQKAIAAGREAEGHPSRDRSAVCDGQATAFRAVAAILGVKVTAAVRSQDPAPVEEDASARVAADALRLLSGSGWCGASPLDVGEEMRRIANDLPGHVAAGTGASFAESAERVLREKGASPVLVDTAVLLIRSAVVAR